MAEYEHWTLDTRQAMCEPVQCIEAGLGHPTPILRHTHCDPERTTHTHCMTPPPQPTQTMLLLYLETFRTVWALYFLHS